MKKIIPNLWFDDQAEEAARFYVSIFPNSKIGAITHYGDAASEIAGRPKGSVMTVAFELDGNPFLALNGGPLFQFNESISFIVECKTQDEIDRYWNAFTASGGSEQACGWLKDRYGVSWQIVPDFVSGQVEEKDPAKFERVMKALLGMKKLDIATLKRAAEGG